MIFSPLVDEETEARGVTELLVVGIPIHACLTPKLCSPPQVWSVSMRFS